MRAFTALCGLLSSTAASVTPTPPELEAAGLAPETDAIGSKAVTLQLASGKVEGKVTNKDVQRYLGVPYAEPPLGDLRWQPPQAKAAWEGVREAKMYTKSCIQESNAFSLLTGVSEDCLYLNLWVPNGPPPPAGEKYAAMIFFYGGSWTSGSAMFPLYAGESLTAANNATVVVTINYRLAAMGFLGSEFLRSSDGSAGNWGLQDQRLAMQWVRANAEQLNVDTSRIMIFGESAGAGSTSAHLVSHRSRGLFTRAAMESGPFADWTSVAIKDAEPRFAKFASNLGCTVPAAGDASKATPAEIAALQSCMRSKNQTEVLNAMHHLPGVGLPGTPDWSPVVDNVEFTDEVQILASRGDIANVPTLFGTNKNEGTGFVGIGEDSNVTDLDAYIVQQFQGQSKAHLDRLKAAYPVSDFKKTLQATAAWWTASEMVGDSEMTCAARRTARFLSTLRGAKPAPAFVYYFTHELAVIPAIELVGKHPLGVFHGSELALVFEPPVLAPGLTKAEKELSMKVRQYWTNFAYSGNPNIGRDNAADSTLPNWPAHEPATNLTLNLSPALGTLSNLKGERCDLWDSFGPLYPIPK